MRRRFGRRRRRNDDGRDNPIDASWLDRLSGMGGLADLERVEYEDVPASLALLATARGEDGARWAVAVAPASGGDAVLAALVAAARIEGVSQLVAAASRWDEAARRRLAAARSAEAPLRAWVLGDEPGGAATLAVSMPGPTPLPAPEQLAAQLARPADRALHARALDALRGLAAKHGGAVRAAGRGIELAVLARRVACLRTDGEVLLLETLENGRQSERLGDDNLAEQLDRLEGAVRKRLADRYVRDGEEGLRGRALPALAAAAQLRDVVRWPLGGSDLDAVDLVAVTADGAPVVGAVRERWTLRGVGRVLDAALALEPFLPALLAGAAAPVRYGPPRLALAGRETEAAVDEALARLAVTSGRFDLEERGGVAVLRPREGSAAPASRATAAPAPVPVPVEPRAPRAEASAERASVAPAEQTPEREGEADEDEASAPRRGRRRGRSRGRGRRRGGRGEAAAAGDESEESEEAAAAEPGAPRYEEMSLFDLDDEAGEEEGEGGARRRRGRRRGRGRTRRGGEEAPRREASTDGSPDEEGEEAEGGSRGRGGGRRRGRAARSEPEPVEAAPDEDEDEDELLGLSPDAPDLEEQALPAYDDDEEELDEPESEADRIRLEREKRRLARLAKGDPPPVPGRDAEQARGQDLPRGRAAILVHADRDSIAAAVVLARDWRQIEGIWIYPQSELMTFFRGVATDLRENTPIFVVGFTPSPARDAIQAASLYRNRLAWFDHHEWPPEDRGLMAEAIGEDHLHLEPGAGSTLPAVLGTSTRRSRFSDKLVDLATGRFTPHDFQRWGRLWWWRLGELAGKTGERRSALEPLLVGRPSDLAKEASRIEPPPLPAEFAYARERDFRLVHFAGLALVVAEVPETLDLHLTLRIVRERYAAPLSLGRSEGSDLVVLGADDISGRRAMDVTGMVHHLAAKFAWVRPLPDADHVARFRVQGLADRSERFEEVLSEIGMGRSILEG